MRELSEVRRGAARWVDHPWLVGDPGWSGERTARHVERLLTIAVLLANITGAIVVGAFILWVLPKPEGMKPAIQWLNVGLGTAYLAASAYAGRIWRLSQLQRGEHGTSAWLHVDQPPTPEQRRRALQAPVWIMLHHAVLWTLAAIVFAGLNATQDGWLALGVGLTVLLGGGTTAATVYLASEMVMRPIAARALVGSEGERRTRVPGVALRALLAWGLGTGVPVFGLLLVGLIALTPVSISRHALAVTIVVLCAIGLIFGAVLTVLAAYLTVHPIRAIRLGLDRVRAGDLQTRVGVWDSTEVGLLQTGFNDMVMGLEERERLRDAFGRQVGEDVARRALEGEIVLGGEVRDAAILFCDIVGSTAIAARRSPEEVVVLLNRFFAVVVDVVQDSGGWINKFQGDGALAVFGAPIALPGAGGRALRSARILAERLAEDVPELDIGIGVAAGPVVAGHIGAERRFEYTVIGDAANEAARLCELAKGTRGRVLASAETLARPDAAEEARHWRPAGEARLRGRPGITPLVAPIGAGAEGDPSAL